MAKATAQKTAPLAPTTPRPMENGDTPVSLGTLTDASLTASPAGIAHRGVGRVQVADGVGFRDTEPTTASSGRLEARIMTDGDTRVYVLTFGAAPIAKFPLTLAGMADLYGAIIGAGIFSASNGWHTPHDLACQLLPGTADVPLRVSIQDAIRRKGGTFASVTLRPSAVTEYRGNARYNRHSPRFVGGKSGSGAVASLSSLGSTLAPAK